MRLTHASFILALAATAAACGGPDFSGTYATSIWTEEIRFAADDIQNNQFDTTISAQLGANNAVTLLVGQGGSCRLNGTVNGSNITITAGQMCSFNDDFDGMTGTYAYTFTGGTGSFSSVTTYMPRTSTTTTCPPKRRCQTSTRTITSSSTSTFVNLDLTANVTLTIGSESWMGTGTIKLNGAR